MKTETVTDEGRPLSQRGQTREELRRRIVAAARDLLSETASTEFSMRALASKADVGHVTPYNIFGSKQGVLLAVLDADMADFERALRERAQSDPLNEMFEVVRLCTDFWFSAPSFYKTLYAELLDSKGARQPMIATPLRDGFWRRLASRLIMEGQLQDFVAEQAFSNNLRRIVLQTIRSWIARDLSKEDVEAELGYSLSLALLGVVVPTSQRIVMNEFLKYQSILSDASQRAKA